MWNFLMGGVLFGIECGFCYWKMGVLHFVHTCVCISCVLFCHYMSCVGVYVFCVTK